MIKGGKKREKVMPKNDYYLKMLIMPGQISSLQVLDVKIVNVRKEHKFKLFNI